MFPSFLSKQIRNLLDCLLTKTAIYYILHSLPVLVTRSLRVYLQCPIPGVGSGLAAFLKNSNLVQYTEVMEASFPGAALPSLLSHIRHHKKILFPIADRP